MSDVFGEAVIIDAGSGFTKVGIAGAPHPQLTLETIVGRPHRKGGLKERCRGMNDAYVGSGAQNRRGILLINYPIERGCITSFDDLEEIWKFSFEDLALDSKEHPVLLSMAPLTKKKDQWKMAEIMFEKFQVQGLNIVDTLTLTHSTTAQPQAVIIDCGEGVTHVGAFICGKPVNKTVGRYEYGGRDLTTFLTGNIRSAQFPIKHELVRDIKEKYCYVSTNFDEELATATSAIDKVYMAEGAKVTVGTGRFRCPEALFSPSFLRIEAPGLHTAVYHSILSCENQILREELFKNIYISGGSANFPGLAKRMEEEISSLVPNLEVRVSKTIDPAYAAWTGGSSIAHNPFSDRIWKSLDDFRVPNSWFCF